MAFKLEELPYAMTALAPHISKETLEFHYGKHHQTYVDNLNKLTLSTPLAEQSLEQIVMTASGGIFNNAAQIWNHTFYRHSLSPEPRGGGEPKGALAETIKSDFGSFAKFKEEFTTKATTLFGSGWVFLVKNRSGKLEITQEPNAGCPLTKDQKPILTCDVWEHAYYIDYRNARAKYLESFWKLVNWSFANSNLK